MDADERAGWILAALRDRGTLAISDVASELHVSAITVRRELAALADKGLLARTRGGARNMLLRGEDEPYEFRARSSLHLKQRIAAAAERLIADGEALVLDSGTTAVGIAGLLASRRVTVMPLSVQSVATLGASSSASVILPGGEVRAGEGSISGSSTEHSLAGLRFDTFLMSCCGLEAAAGVTAYDLQDAAVKRAAISSSARVIALADGSKIGRVTMAVVAAVSDVHAVITDDSADARELDAVRATGVDVVVA